MSESLPASPEALDLDSLASIEQPFVGQWNRLISTTNWEKGRIIYEWREALVQAGAPSSEYTDETWSLRVGGVTSQHVGRLRRVYQRFGADHDRFQGLYWSHFQAAIDWDDAEMWLEGAVQNDWSVSTMRTTRWETLGSVPAEQPQEGEVAAVEMDEDHDRSHEEEGSNGRAHFDDGSPLPEGPDFGDADESYAGTRGDDGYDSANEPAAAGPPVRPFENLSELPPDLGDAFESFKLAILRHKTDGWQQISLPDVLGSLDALKELAQAP